MEMMNLKPSFARKLNKRGFSPLHLASQYAKKKMVDDLLSVDKDLVRVKGREGYTPLHCAAREGDVPLLSKFLEECPNFKQNLCEATSTSKIISIKLLL
ncbi:protein of unknown function DUF3447 - like 10 [Theobroma cacao]|nr:protein of unknown function DUF3447 - like 10 [Theobroma cacao]